MRPMSAAFTFAGVGVYVGTVPASFRHQSIGSYVLVCFVGASFALLGYGVGRLIDKARR